MKIKYLLFFLILPLYSFASSGETDTDFVPRVVNFLIFFGILYYLLADIIRNFFSGRIQGIADELENIQKRLKESQSAKVKAIESVNNAKIHAKEIIETAKGEAEILAKKIQDDATNEILSIEKAHSERIEIEERKMVREVVSEIVDDIFEDDSVSLNRDDFVNLVLKKAA